MRWLLSICFCLSGWAQALSIGDAVFLERLKAASDPTLVWLEGFEATGAGVLGFDNTGWDLQGTTTPDPNYVTAPAPLTGVQSLFLNDTGTDAQITNNFPATGEIWVRWQVFYPLLYAGARDGLHIFDNAGNDLAWARIEGVSTTNRLDLNVLGVGLFNAQFLIPTNTVIEAMLHLKKGSGANAITELWWTNTLPFSTASYISNGAGSSTFNSSAIRIHEEQKQSIWDNIRIFTARPSN